MKTYLVRWKHGLELEIQAASFDWKPPALTFFDAEGNKITKYMDGEIAECVEKEEGEQP